MSKILYLITHEHKQGSTQYTAVRDHGEEFDLNAYIQDENINFEEDRGEFINFEAVDLPKGFIITEAGQQGQRQDAEAIAELVSLVDAADNQDIVHELDELIHDALDGAASRINNAGVYDQIKYLVFEDGLEETTRKVSAIVNEHSDKPRQQ